MSFFDVRTRTGPGSGHRTGATKIFNVSQLFFKLRSIAVARNVRLISVLITISRNNLALSTNFHIPIKKIEQMTGNLFANDQQTQAAKDQDTQVSIFLSIQVELRFTKQPEQNSTSAYQRG